MPLSCQDLLHHCLLLDIEVNERNEIYSIGAVLGDTTFQRTAQKGAIDSRVLEKLDNLAGNARFLLGHNIINHDLPRLRQVAPNLQVFTKPAIDTLFLSPLAYPANPYHRLIKNYQIVRDSINDPVQDALLAAHVFNFIFYNKIKAIFLFKAFYFMISLKCKIRAGLILVSREAE